MPSLHNKYSVFVIALAFSLLGTHVYSQTVAIYASPNGANTGNGASFANPVSLNEAVIVAKSFPNDTCTVLLEDGFYTQLKLDNTSSRLASAPVIYKAINPHKAIFQPLTLINSSSFQTIPDSIRGRILDGTAKTKVMQLPLASFNLKNMAVWPNVFGIANLTSPKFYNNGVVLPMSRYPKDSNMAMKKVLNNGVGGKLPGATFVYRNDRCKYWLKEIADAGLFLSGAWRVPWEVDVVKTQDIDTLADTIQQVAGVTGGIGDKYTRPKGNGKEPYWAINLVEEISTPGEWSINFRTKMLYIWLPDSANIQVASDPAASSISLAGVSNTFFKNIAIVGGAGDGFTLNNCNNITIAGCDISNISGNGVTITGGSNCTVLSNDIHFIGGAGVKIASANYLPDQLNVTLSNHRVVNNHIYTVGVEKQVYYPAVDVSTAIGTYVGNNLMNDVPQICVYWGGNSNTVEYNEAANVGNKYGGAAAFYRTGNFADRGNKVRYNYVHDSPFGGGISEDNNGTGDSIYYNIIANTQLGSNNNGGYADVFSNNIYVNNAPAHSSGITKDTSAQYIKYYKNLQTIYNSSAAYRAAYPDVAAMLDTVNNANKAYTSLEWNRFNCNVFISNTQSFGGIKDTAFFNTNGTQKASATLAKAAAFKTYGTVVHDNCKINWHLISPIQPFSVDSLKAVAAFDRICGTDWHINRLGLYKDQYRTNIDSTVTQGINPQITWQQDSISGDTITLNALIVNPNIANSISSVQYLLDSSVITPLSVKTKSISFDTVLYSAVITGVSAGSHAASLIIYDAPKWKYQSNLDTFTIVKPLPVQLLNFKGTTIDCKAQLVWTTAEEIGIKDFEVEKSFDGINFNTIKNIIPKGNTSGSGRYNCIIAQPEALVYYRLKITDQFGKSTYSNVVSVTTKCGLDDNLILYPNPVVDCINLKSVDNGEYTVRILNFAGKLVYNRVGIAVVGNKLTLNISSLPNNATYFIELTDRYGNKQMDKFIKE